MITNKKEISWINLIKILCLLIVYFDHSTIYSQASFPILESFYYPFFVNIFFFMSGYLLFKKQLSDEAINVSKPKFIIGGGKTQLLNILSKIMFPSVLFSVIVYFPKKWVRGDEITSLSFIKETILGGSMWFTCALAVAELLILGMLLFRQRNLIFYVVISVLLSITAVWIKDCGFTILSSDTLPWFYKSGMIATLFLVSGGVYNHYETSIDRVLGHWYLAVILILVYSVVAICLPEYAEISLQISLITIPGFILSLISIYVIIYLAKRFRSYSLINSLGRQSLGIYLLSGAIPNVMAVIFAKYGFQNIYLNVGMVTAISFLMGIFAVYILNKICPFVFNLSLLWKFRRSSREQIDYRF